MQSFIDIILDRIRLDGLAINRGDKIGPDFTLTDFTFDNTWRELDLSVIVPIGAHVVYASSVLRGTALLRTVYFRTQGFTTEHVISRISTQLTNVFNMSVLTVFPNPANAKVGYKGTTLIDFFSLTILGWDY